MLVYMVTTPVTARDTQAVTTRETRWDTPKRLIESPQTNQPDGPGGNLGYPANRPPRNHENNRLDPNHHIHRSDPRQKLTRFLIATHTRHRMPRRTVLGIISSPTATKTGNRSDPTHGCSRPESDRLNPVIRSAASRDTSTNTSPTRIMICPGVRLAASSSSTS